MKKIVTILPTVLMVISLVACGGEKGSTEDGTPDTGSATEMTSTENGQADDEIESEPVDEEEGMKILVAYFSATNTTEGVAEQIADSLSADIYEIIPEQPYTDADLDYHDDNSRSTIEMNDPSARPAIAGSVEDMEQYSVVFIGYAGGIIGLN